MFNTMLNNVADRESPCITAVDIQVGFILLHIALTPLTNLEDFLVYGLSFSD